MTELELIRRLRAYERGQQVALAIGVLPLLAVYIAVHTRWLKPLLQDHKHLMVALMIFMPLAWLFALAQGWKRLGPRWLDLRCAACGTSLAALAPTRGAGPVHCPSCRAAVVEDGPTTR